MPIATIVQTAINMAKIPPAARPKVIYMSMPMPTITIPTIPANKEFPLPGLMLLIFKTSPFLNFTIKRSGKTKAIGNKQVYGKE